MNDFSPRPRGYAIQRGEEARGSLGVGVGEGLGGWGEGAMGRGGKKKDLFAHVRLTLTFTILYLVISQEKFIFVNFGDGFYR